MKVPWMTGGDKLNRKCDEEIKPMRITRIGVDGLFGMFNHDIGMKTDDRITIIHGMNGYGKTTILRMVNALFNRRYSDLRSTPFKEFRVDLEDGSTISVSKLNGDRTIGGRNGGHTASMFDF